MTALLTEQEAAARLRIGERTLRDERKRGAIRYVLLGKRKIFYRPEDCDDYVAACLKVEQPCHTNPKPKRAGVSSGKIVPFSKRHG